jgi:hypothetical protein
LPPILPEDNQVFILQAAMTTISSLNKNATGERDWKMSALGDVAYG